MSSLHLAYSSTQWLTHPSSHNLHYRLATFQHHVAVYFLEQGGFGDAPRLIELYLYRYNYNEDPIGSSDSPVL